MDIFEFELRYKAYDGFSTLYKQGRDSSLCVNLAKLRSGIVMDKKIQEVTPKELREMTDSTYSRFKLEFLETAQEVEIVSSFSLNDYIQRLEYELKVIKEMGFNTYFLIVADFVQWSKANEIMVGPGRGSGAGSLLAYCLQITDVDPLPYGLLFERFLNPARVSMPDFDIDFEDTLREKVIHYVTDLYGQDKVCAIGTYMQLASKAAFKDTARAFGMPFDRANLISNLVTDSSIREMLEKPEDYDEFMRLYNQDPVVKKSVDLSLVLEGNLRQLGVHACGIIISPDPVVTYTPVQPIVKGGAAEEDAMMVSQYDGKVLETIGLLKMDFLGLRNLSVIKNCAKIIRAKHQSDGTPLPALFADFFATMSFQPPLDDAYTYEKVFQSGDTTGIFQFEGDGMRRFLVQLKASNLNDLVAMSALYRPGPMEFIPRYIARKHGEEEVTYMSAELRKLLESRYDTSVADEEERKLIEDLAPIMGLTFGIAVYQEQLMFLVQSMAGFSLAEADLLRRGIGKKIKEVIESLKKEFIEKSASYKLYKPETSQYVYEKMIEPAAAYSFNKSHSVCYSLIAYQTGYLKAHYPVEFYAALLRSKEEDTDKLSIFIDEVKEHGIAVLLPDINESFNHVSAEGSSVRLGFLSVKGIGFDIGEFIENQRRSHGKYVSLEDFLKRCHSVINKKSLEGLIKSGALDAFGSRQTFLFSLTQMLERSKHSLQAADSLFGGTDLANVLHFEKIIPTSLQSAMMMEYEVFKAFVSVHPFDGLYQFLKKFTFVSQMKDVDNYGACELLCYIKEIRRARKKGFFVTFEDITGSFDVFLKEKLDFKVFDIVLIKGYKGFRMSLNSMETIDLTALRDEIKRRKLYDPEMTAMKVKSMRSDGFVAVVKPSFATSPEETETIDDLSLEDDGLEAVTPELDPNDDESDTVSSGETTPSLEFAMPTTITDVIRVRSTLNMHGGGDQSVTIGGTEYFITKEGVALLQKLFSDLR